MCNYVNQINQG